MGSVGPTGATPDLSLWRREVVLGSNAKSYYVLSFERIHSGYHDVHSERLALLRYARATGKLEQRTVLRETNYSRANPGDPVSVTERPTAGDVSLGGFLTRERLSLAYPVVLDGASLAARKDGIYLIRGAKAQRLVTPDPKAQGLEEFAGGKIVPLEMFADRNGRYVMVRFGLDSFDTPFRHKILAVQGGDRR